MTLRCFGASSRPLSNSAKGEAGLGQGAVLRLQRGVHANADLDSLAPRFAIEAREAIREHLGALFAPESTQPGPAEESSMEASCSEPLLQGASDPKSLPAVISEAQREELAEDNATRHDWIAEGGKQERDIHGRYSRTADFRISTTDPDATPMRLKGEELIWATIPIMSLMEASVESSWRCWSCQAKSWIISPCLICSDV
jgi:hypothetical protein